MNPERNCYTRAPRGVGRQKAIGLRLLPSELSRVRRHAKALNCSAASFARMMTLAGMRAYEEQAPHATTVPPHDGGVSIREAAP